MVFYLIPFISAAIGWFTNYIAIKMLFYPRREKNYYLFKLQGIFPKRKSTLAKRLGKVVAKDLFSMQMIKDRLDTEENRAELKKTILLEFEDYLVNKFKAGNPMLGMLMSDSVVKQVIQKIENMLDELIPKMFGKLTAKLEQVDIEQLVYEKVMRFSDEKFEALLMSVIKKELKFIEIAGAVLGFVIGLLQVGLILLGNRYEFLGL